MKRLCLIIAIFLSFAFCNAQNIVSVLHSPTDMGIGLRYDRQIQDYGFYMTGSHGEYRFEDRVNHNRVSLGVSNYKTEYATAVFSAGIVFNQYERAVSNTRPVSFEFGGGGVINKVFIGFLFDPLNWEGAFCFGIRL